MPKKQSRKVGVPGGFINQLKGNNSTLPVTGQGATILYYSDREAYEVISTSSDQSKCTIRKMDTTFIGQCYGDERYKYQSNPENNTTNLEWNEKKSCWGHAWTSTEIIKSLKSKLIKEHGYDWVANLPVPYTELIDGEYTGVTTQLKLVKGVTKEYKNFSEVSIIFGEMDQYRDPSF